jgi:hypothetical protein
LVPAAVRTYAPRGETPILKYPHWEHLSVIIELRTGKGTRSSPGILNDGAKRSIINPRINSAITLEGKLYTTIQDETFRGPDIVRFLKHLLRHIPGKLPIAVNPSKTSCAKVLPDASILNSCLAMRQN